MKLKSRLKEFREIQALIGSLVLGKSFPETELSRWTEAHIEAARENSVTPWLYVELRKIGEHGLVPELWEQLQADYRRSAISSMRREASLQLILQALGEAGIDVVLLKGACLAESLYEDPAARPMLDIDLLVRDGQEDDAGRVLESLDYGRVLGEPDYFHRLFLPAFVYRRPAAFPDYVDLHWRLVPMDYYTLPSSTLWSDVVQAPKHGPRVFYLSKELNFTFTALHCLNHRGGLRDWLDLLLLLEREDFNWERLGGLAIDLGVERPLYWTFEEIESRWGVSAPEEFTRMMSARRPAWIEDKLIRGRYYSFWRLLARLDRLPGWGVRAKYLSSRMLPSKSFRTSVTGSSSWLAYLLSRLHELMRGQ